MILETILVLAGAAIQPLYETYAEKYVDSEKSAIRLRCKAQMLDEFAALKKSRKAARAAKEAKAHPAKA